MKNRAKKNNKGFSLVELIVVVLIIGVIAVALAPQVMKWVDASKDNTDSNNANTLKSAVQAALADWQNDGGKLAQSKNAIYTVDSTSTLVADISTGEDWKYGTEDSGKLSAYIAEVTAGEYVMPNDTTKKFEIVVEKDKGKVTISQVAK